MATAEIRQHVSTVGSLAPREAALHEAPLREALLPLLISALDARTPRAARQRARPPSMPHYHAGGGACSIARYARASGGQG